MRIYTIILLCLMVWGVSRPGQAQSGQHTTPEAVLEANIEATGGAEAWAAIKTIRREGTREMESPMGGTMKGTFVEHVRIPGYSHREMEMATPMGSQKQATISTPDKAWIESPRGKLDIPVSPWATLGSAKEEVGLLEDDAFSLASLETEIGDAGPIYIIAVEHDGSTYTRHYDQLTLMLLAAEQPSARGGKEWVYYDDYRDVEGVKMAHTVTTTARLTIQRGGGGPEHHTTEVVSTVETVAFNVPVMDSLFSE